MKKILFTTTVFISLFLLANPIFAQDIAGEWKTIDDETGKARSVVKIYKSSIDGKYYGKIVQLFTEPGENPDPLCSACTGNKHNQRIIGMIIITGMAKFGNEWSGGRILDPSNGKTYKCKMWLEGGKLHVRGYIGVPSAGRTQVWEKY